MPSSAGDLVLLERAAAGVAAPDPHRRPSARGLGHQLFSSRMRLELVGHLRQRLLRRRSARRRGRRVTTLTFPNCGVGGREVVAGVAAAALLALDRRARDRLGDGEHVVQVERQVPAGVVLAVALRRSRVPAAPGARRARPAPARSSASVADDADQVLHAVLEVGVDGVRVLAAGRSRTARASRRSPASTCVVVDAPARRLRPGRTRRRTSPARRPKTSRSESELPPSRFAPCSPAATSPAANRPGTVVAVVSASTRTPPIM